MATPGELSAAVAQILGISEPTVRVHDHNLARAGIRTAGGRGRSAAKVTARDAAALIITVLTSATLRDSLDAFADYSTLVVVRGRTPAGPIASSAWELPFLSAPTLTGLGPEHTLLDFIAALISAGASGELPLPRHKLGGDIRHTRGGPADVSLSVKLMWPWASAEASIWSQEQARGLPPNVISKHENEKETHIYFPSFKRKSQMQIPNTDLEVDRTFSDKTIFAISSLLKGGE